jgi:hypothetical protein
LAWFFECSGFQVSTSGDHRHILDSRRGIAGPLYVTASPAAWRHHFDVFIPNGVDIVVFLEGRVASINESIEEGEWLEFALQLRPPQVD